MDDLHDTTIIDIIDGTVVEMMKREVSEPPDERAVGDCNIVLIYYS